MRVTFRRTGERRSAVVVEAPGEAAQTMSPAPGFDEHIPHDLVHYALEATLGLEVGVFGRAACGGGNFYAAETASNPREQARKRRKQARREQALRRERANREQLQTSERLAYLSDIAWRRRHGQRPDLALSDASSPISVLDAARIERVVSVLDELAPQWHRLAVGGELTFTWPSVVAVSRGGSLQSTPVAESSRVPSPVVMRTAGAVRAERGVGARPRAPTLGGHD